MAGVLVLVVGPSGAGKDTLIREAQRALASNPRYCFARRLVTRVADAELEDHDSVAPEDFERRRIRGDFALDWEAHGLSYALPASIDAALLAGRIVVANGSRRVVARAIQKYRNCAVVQITARPEVLASRLAGRGRETQTEITERLARRPPPLPAGLMPVLIDNSGPLEAGVRRFLDALKRLAG